ncbi:hypothetical protein UFOVP835_46 [uncultured Caudovirales phage]|uniref:Uncharacterized protein n=1 Tax=uncultured Caudovirales phage TaxID=2100421 RepID=A0A6J5P6B7_9CAUD|nr:hypothetical protein UFOVP835_46 [uncultured Caudovirales phage]
MILSEFVLTHTKGRSPIDWVYFADVSVTTTTGVLWWKKKHVERRKITREYDGFWHFVDNGKHCPVEALALERSYRAREKLADA